MKTEFTKNGWTHRQVRREGRIAIFERFKGDRRQLHYEVVRIKAFKAHKRNFGGKETDVPAGESYPSSEAWGTDGFTLNDRFEADTKFAELLGTEDTK